MKRFLYNVLRPKVFQTKSLFQQRFSTVQQQEPYQQPIPPIIPNSAAENFKYYASLRIYKDHSWYELVNLICMTTLFSNNFFVHNSHRIYTLTHKVFGPRVTDYMIASTFGRIFTAGDTLETMNKFIDNWRYPNINFIVGYSNEIAPGQPALIDEMDESARIFAESVKLATKDKHEHNDIAIKCSCMIPPTVMKKASEAQLRLRAIFSERYGNLSQTLTAKQLSDRFEDLKVNFTFEEFQEFVRVLLNKDVTYENLDQVSITKFEWLKDIHMFYVQNQQKNNNQILKQLNEFTKEDQIELERHSQRLDSIFKVASERQCPVLVDAEQTYYQETIDSFTFQFSAIYNNERAIVLNTFQNYLKVTKDKIRFEVERCKFLNQPFGAKMVRGAYMIEERQLACEYGYEDPVQPSIQATTDSYHNNLEFLLKNWIQGSGVVIASHNESTVRFSEDLRKKYDINSSRGNFSFAQLLGLGDHVTFSLAEKGLDVAKYVAFGPIPIMIPFFIRRAQESKQMFSSTALQRRLVLNEVGQRLKKKL